MDHQTKNCIRILVIDDEPLVAKAVCRALPEHRVVTAFGGQQALEELKFDSTFDLILCDLAMPKMDGPAFYNQVKQTSPGLEKNIVFMTGGVFVSHTRQFLDSIPNQTIQKPFNVEDLHQLIKQWTKEK
ncbi:MAG: response regulator [Pseudomonadota bacterium]